MADSSSIACGGARGPQSRQEGIDKHRIPFIKLFNYLQVMGVPYMRPNKNNKDEHVWVNMDDGREPNIYMWIRV